MCGAQGVSQFYESSWRRISAPIIRRVLSETEENELARRKALRDAYPFGERRYHPYKIWCDEIQRQLGKKPKLGTFGAKSKERKAVIDRDTLPLFGDVNA